MPGPSALNVQKPLKKLTLVSKFFASEGNRHLVGVPRWGPFTEILPKLAAQGVEFHVQGISTGPYALEHIYDY